MTSVTRRLLWLAALGLGACGRISTNETTTGTGGSAGAGGSSETVMATPDGGEACYKTGSLAPARVVLLTDAQFKNAVRDVFGVELQGDVGNPNPASGSYPEGESATVSDIATVLKSFNASTDVASKLQPCGANPPASACVEQFLRTKVPLAWRRPVTDDEIAGIMGLFNAGTQISAQRAVEVVVKAVLGSGSFLYRSEIGKDASTGASPIALTAYELASAVSFAFLDSVPDAELWAKAQDGSLLQPEVLSAEADRLLAVPAVSDTLKKKVSSYLNLELLPSSSRIPVRFPEFTPSMRDGLYRGAQMFVDEIFSHGHFRDILTSHRVYANQEVASVYGIPGVTGTAVTAVDFTGDERGFGIVTQPAFLAATSWHSTSDDVAHRGLYVADKLACGPQMPPPPPGEDMGNVMGDPREQTLQIDATEACAACHKVFDPIGLSMLNYDAIGRYRTANPDTGKPIDATAVITGFGPESRRTGEQRRRCRQETRCRATCFRLRGRAFHRAHARPRREDRQPLRASDHQRRARQERLISRLLQGHRHVARVFTRNLETP